MLQLEGPHLDKAEAVVVPVHLNMAAAQLRLGDYNTAIHNCGQVRVGDGVWGLGNLGVGEGSFGCG
jgi:hypothetical protein